MDFTNYLTMRSSNVATMRAAHLSLSTLTGSTLALTTHITAPMAIYSTMMSSTIAVSTLTGSTLFGSTMLMSSIQTSFLTLSTLTVSSINNNAPGTGSFSTFTVSSLVSVSSITSASTIYGSSLRTIGNVGIGTMTPISQLGVHGNTSTAITVSNGFNAGFYTQYGLAHSAGQYSANSLAGDTVIEALGGNLIIESQNKNIYLSMPSTNTSNVLSIAGSGTRSTFSTAGWGSLTNTQQYSNINLSWTAPVTCTISSISMYLGQGNNGTNISLSVNGTFINEWWPFQGYGLYVINATGSSTANGVATTPTPFSALNQLVVQAGQVLTIYVSALQTYNFFYYGRDSTTSGVGFSIVYNAPKVDLSLLNTATTLSLGLAGVGIGTTAPSGTLDIGGIIRMGNYTGGNYDNIQFMRTTTGLYPNIRCLENYIGMYVTDTSGWIAGSVVGDMVIRPNTGSNLRLGIGNTAGLILDSACNVIINHRELRINQLNSSQGQFRIKSGNQNISMMLHCNGYDCYFLNTNDGDWTANYNSHRPLRINLQGGGCIMDNGLTVNNRITVANGDNSMTYYGPNSTWNSYLVVGAGTQKSGASTAHVISTNGNLHLDGGNNNAIIYGQYANSNGAPNIHYFYGHIHVATSSYMSFGSTDYLFPIYIPYGRSYYFHLYHYLHTGGVHNHNSAWSWNVSIWTDGVLVTSAWYGTVSDQRIKKNIQPVGPMLETINKIEIVSFDFIDEPNNKRDECGIIAQQLETVFPNAVDTSIGVIPCYLKFATNQHNVGDDVHILFEYDNNDVQQQFKVGDKIKIHAGQKTATVDKDKGSHHVVVKSMIDGGFITEKWKDYEAEDGVFVHGKEVDDFRNVDKEQLGILALKGVQELSSSVAALNGTCAALQAANATTSSHLAALNGTCATLQAAEALLQQENAQLKSQMATLNGTCASLQAANAATSSQMAALMAWAQAQGYSS